MADDFAAVSAPEIDLGGAEDTASTETQEIGSESTETTDSIADERAQETKEFRAVENGKLSAEAKQTIEELKAKNPALAKALQRSLFAEDRLRRELPGGFKELQQLRGQLEPYGGPEGLEQIQGELKGWEDFDQSYTSGDPKVLEFLTKTPEAKDAFLKIVPNAIQKWSEFNQEGHDAYMSQIFLATMNAADIEMNVRLLQNAVGENPQAQELVKNLMGFVQSIKGMASKPVSAPKVAPTAQDPRTSELDNRETQLRRQEWTGETNQQHGRIFGEAWKRIAATVPADKQGLVRRLYGIHLGEKIKARANFDQNMTRYFDAKQKDGFLRLHESTFKDLVPLALRSAMAEAGLGAKKAAPPPANGVPLKPPVGQQPQAGWVRLNNKPNFATEVDRKQTSPEMYSRKQAILKTGKRVTWA